MPQLLKMQVLEGVQRQRQLPLLLVERMVRVTKGELRNTAKNNAVESWLQRRSNSDTQNAQVKYDHVIFLTHELLNCLDAAQTKCSDFLGFPVLIEHGLVCRNGSSGRFELYQHHGQY